MRKRVGSGPERGR